MVHQGESTSNSCIKHWFTKGSAKPEANEASREESTTGSELAPETAEDTLRVEPATAGTKSLQAVNVELGDEEEVADETHLFSLSTALLATEDAKTRDNLRLAYQVPEAPNGPCGRTFEDAFILANQTLFEITGATNDVLAKAAQDKAEKQKKSKFALTYAIKKTNWVTPRYIADGLRWLATSNVAVVDPGISLAVEAKTANLINALTDTEAPGVFK